MWHVATFSSKPKQNDMQLNINMHYNYVIMLIINDKLLIYLC